MSNSLRLGLRQIRVLHVGTSSNGGAGIAQVRIASAVEAASKESTPVKCDNFFGNEHPLGSNLEFEPHRLRKFVTVGLHRFWSRGIPYLLGSSELRTVAKFRSGLGMAINRSNYDIIHLHWIGDGVLSIEEIGEIRKPIVWTFHDLWPVGGAAHYPATPILKRETKMAREAANNLRNRLQSVLLSSIDSAVRDRRKRSWRRQFVAVSPSHWLLEHVKQDSFWSEMPAFRVPNPISLTVSTDLKNPETSSGTRGKVLDLLFVSSSGISDPRKGWDLLAPCLQALKELLPSDVSDAVVLTTVGPGNPPPAIPGIHMRHLGELNQHQMSKIYREASLTLIPSVFDNFPNVALESIAHGTPVVGSYNSGIPEIVTHEFDGGLVDWSNPGSAASFIASLLTSQEKLTEFSKRCLAKASYEFSEEAVGKMYLDVYMALLDGDKV